MPDGQILRQMPFSKYFAPGHSEALPVAITDIVSVVNIVGVVGNVVAVVFVVVAGAAVVVVAAVADVVAAVADVVATAIEVTGTVVETAVGSWGQILSSPNSTIAAGPSCSNASFRTTCPDVPAISRSCPILTATVIPRTSSFAPVSRKRRAAAATTAGSSCDSPSVRIITRVGESCLRPAEGANMLLRT